MSIDAGKAYIAVEPKMDDFEEKVSKAVAEALRNIAAKLDPQD